MTYHSFSSAAPRYLVSRPVSQTRTISVEPFFPDVIDKWAHLQYVLRGRLNDLGDTITGFKGVYNGKEIQWSEVEKQYKFAEL